VFQTVEPELKLRSYGERKPFWTLIMKVVLQVRLQQRILVDGTAQKQQQTWEFDNTIRYGSHWE